MSSPSSRPVALRRPVTLRRRVRAAAVLVVAASTITLSSCGGDDNVAADSNVSQDAPSSEQGASMEEFQQCLADNGVDLGAPQSGGQGGTRPSIDQDAMQQAQDACGDLMPQGGPGQGGPGGGFDSEAVQAWTDCLADNGVEVEMPGAGGSPEQGELPEPPADGAAPDGATGGEAPDAGSMFGLDTSDPEVAAAVDACQELQPDLGDRPAGAADGSTANGGEAS